MANTNTTRITIVWFVWFVTIIAYCLLSGPLRGQAFDTDLFEDAENVQTEPEEIDPNIVLRQRLVSIHFENLKTDTETLDLNLFDDVLLTAVRDRLENDGSGGFAWMGYIDGVDGSEVTLVVDNEKLSGTIKVPPDFLYQVQPVEKGVHVIREVDLKALPEDADPSAQERSRGDVLLNTAKTAGVLADNSVRRAERKVFRLVNLERTVRGRRTLAYNGKLAKAARRHSKDMSRKRYFSHTSRDGRTPGDRITAVGYKWNTWGENIAFGYSTPQAVMNGWMNSPGHRSNILDNMFCDIGVGYAPNGRYWTQDFARKQGLRRCRR